MTTNPQLLALLAQLRGAASNPASAGFASGDAERAAPLVTAQAGVLRWRVLPTGPVRAHSDTIQVPLQRHVLPLVGVQCTRKHTPATGSRRSPLQRLGCEQAADGAGAAGPDLARAAGSAGVQDVVPALWNLDRVDQTPLPLDGLYRCSARKEELHAVHKLSWACLSESS